MKHWLLKTDPAVYTWDKLVEDRKTIWNQVKNTLALKDLRNIRLGDMLAIYQNGAEQAIIGLAEAVSDPFKDPDSEDVRKYVLEVKPVKKLNRPIALWEMRNNPKLNDFDLLNIPEMNVYSVDEDIWHELLIMGKERV
jgi:predicted RNA-binding protein with PUA-like domain